MAHYVHRVQATVLPSPERPSISISNISTADDDTEDRNQAVTRTCQYEDASLSGRPLCIAEQVNCEAARITECFVYAGHTDAEKVLNLSPVSHYDTAGLTQADSIALTGAPLSVTRRLLKDADSQEVMANWQVSDVSAWNDLLNSEVYHRR